MAKRSVIREEGPASERDRRIEATTRQIFEAFDAYYVESRGIPERAQTAFEARDPALSLDLSRRRLSIYSESIHALGPSLAGAYPELTEDDRPWRRIEALYVPMIEGRYEADLAYAFLNSVRRMIYQDEWKPVEYAFGRTGGTLTGPSRKIYRSFAGGDKLDPGTVEEVLSIPGFATPYQDFANDARLVAERVNDDLGLSDETPEAIEIVQFIDAGFYRNRGAYLVGRIVLQPSTIVPFIIALENAADGVFVDAVLTAEAHTHNIFTSTLANFHVTDPHYHELSAFLHSIMPKRGLGLQYSTIGFNHVGKVAVMNELKDGMAISGERFEAAIGFPGTVAIAFAARSSAYILKVIRDHPTEQYKWGTFDGVESVLGKYGRVHEINRTGSMLDNIIYYNLKLERDLFGPELLSELLENASENVSSQGDAIVFKHLIVQAKVVPLPVYLLTASDDDAEAVINSLGHCIRNNAAANIFNKDLDVRNYGVGAFRKVYLYDYDALEPFTEVKIRTNRDRIDGEEDVPEWFFEDGFIFLPEELQAGLRMPEHQFARTFRRMHGELMEIEFWQAVQDELLRGRVPRVRVYPEACRLWRDDDGLGTYY